MSRRRSAFVGFSAVTLTALGACGGDGKHEVSKTVYRTAAECRAENPGLDCDAAMAKARAEHDKTAPAFNDRQSCEGDWGQENCVEERRGGHSVFVPMMTGFLIGRMLSPGVGPAQPVYTGPRGTFTGGERIGDPAMANGRYTAPGRVSVSEAADGRVGPSRVSRGGFGRAARGLGGRGG